MFKQSQAHMSTSILGPLKLMSESSHTHAARCAASALTILDTSAPLIAVPAFVVLKPNRGERQVLA